MTRDEAIELANEMSFMDSIWIDDNGYEVNDVVNLIQNAAAKEREEIAQFLMRTELGSLPEETAMQYAKLLKTFATLIRVRGEA